MASDFSSVTPSAVVLGAAALFALFLTLTRRWADMSREHVSRLARIAVVTILGQACHFAEELAMGFHERFPETFGLAPIPLAWFVSFNVAWLVIWVLSVLGLGTGSRAASFPLWFLGVACILNGIAHPALSALSGGYFPGLLTSPAVGVLGVLLLRSLFAVTVSG